MPWSRVVRVLGICFAGTSSDHRAHIVQFAVDVLGLARRHVEGVEAELFEMPYGSSFAVASPGGMGESYVHFTAPDGHLYELVERL